MSPDAESRLWGRLWQELDEINRKLDNRVDYRAFNEFKRDTQDELKELKEDIEQLSKAAITPDQVTTMIGTKLQESDARGVTTWERRTRYLIAITVAVTFVFQVWDRYG